MTRTQLRLAWRLQRWELSFLIGGSLLLALALAVVAWQIGASRDAIDVVQDAFLAVWRKAASYTAGRGSVKTWLASIVRNRAIDVVRARRESDSDDEAALLALPDPRPTVLDQVAASLDRALIHSAIEELPLEQRRAIALAYFQGRSHSEISATTGLPLGTVKGRIRLAMQRLRESLGDAEMAPTAGAWPRPPELAGSVLGSSRGH